MTNCSNTVTSVVKPKEKVEMHEKIDMTFSEFDELMLNRYIRVKYRNMKIEGEPRHIRSLLGDKYVFAVEASSNETGMLTVILNDESRTKALRF
jgi:hypothetical protein